MAKKGSQVAPNVLLVFTAPPDSIVPNALVAPIRKRFTIVQSVDPAHTIFKNGTALIAPVVRTAKCRVIVSSVPLVPTDEFAKIASNVWRANTENYPRIAQFVQGARMAF